MRRLQFLPRAERDLHEIWEYLFKEDPRVAMQVMPRIEAAFPKLVHNPGIGHRRSDVGDPAYRFCVVDPWVIAYRYDEEVVTVVRVVHGRRDFRRLFKR